MKRTHFLSTMVGAIALISTSSFAAVGVDHGVYFGGGLGIGKVNESVQGAIKNKRHGFGFNAYAGYQFNKNFALEGDYLNLPNEDFGNSIRGRENYALGVAAKGILPFNNGLDIYGKVGIASVHHEFRSPNVALTGTGSFHRAAMLVGAGADYNLTQNVALTAEFDATTKSGPVPAMTLGTVGLKFNIG